MAATNYAPATLLGATRGWVRADLLPWIDNMATALYTGAVYLGLFNPGALTAEPFSPSLPFRGYGLAQVPPLPVQALWTPDAVSRPPL
jgi:hypothetical protein